MLIVQCLSMLVSTIDMNLLVIAMNSSMSGLDCSPDSVSQSQLPATVSSIRISAPPFSASDVTSRVRDLRYNRATTRSRSNSVPRFLASRYEMQQSAPLTSAHHHIHEFPLVSKADTILSRNRCLSMQCKCLTT